MHELNFKFKTAITLNIISIVFIVLEKFMGNTILGNVIFLGLALIVSFLALLLITFNDSKNIKSLKTILIFISIILIVYCILMFLTNSVPSGYGP